MDRTGAPTARALDGRLADYDWPAAEASLNERGWAALPSLLAAEECQSLREVYGDRRRFRSFVDLGRHGYGERGDYRYFDRPLPPLVRALRTALYARLAPIANRWQSILGLEERFPARLTPFLKRCREHGQSRPTPLLLRYDPDGCNFLHQDRYGDVAFPLQVVCLLSRPGHDFEGGELLLTEQRPRRQSWGEAISLDFGGAVVFPGFERPVMGPRGPARVTLRHGVSRVRRGERMTLGLIFHDAR